jgi:hypothetical protein
MKKLMIIAAALFLSTAAFSQAEFSLGIKAGPNFSNIDTKSSPGANYDNRTGFHGGGFALIKMTKIGIQPELLFSQQGTTVKINQHDLKQSFNYINIPVIFKLYTIAGINIQVGPQFGFVSSAKGDTIDDLGNVRTDQDIKNQLKSSDFSAALGVGWDLPFGLSIDGRYNLGLSDVNKNAAAETIKNQVWQFSLGYKLFKLGGK